MNARISYGSEFDIYTALGQTDPAILSRVNESSRTVLNFSHSLKFVPDEPGFEPLLGELGFAYHSDDNTPDKGSAEVAELPPSRSIEIVRFEPADFQRKKQLGFGLINIALHSERLSHSGVVFIDHTLPPDGKVIACYNFGHVETES